MNKSLFHSSLPLHTICQKEHTNVFLWLTWMKLFFVYSSHPVGLSCYFRLSRHEYCKRKPLFALKVQVNMSSKNVYKFHFLLQTFPYKSLFLIHSLGVFLASGDLCPGLTSTNRQEFMKVCCYTLPDGLLNFVRFAWQAK